MAIDLSIALTAPEGEAQGIVILIRIMGLIPAAIAAGLMARGAEGLILSLA